MEVNKALPVGCLDTVEVNMALPVGCLDTVEVNMALPVGCLDTVEVNMLVQYIIRHLYARQRDWSYACGRYNHRVYLHHKATHTMDLHECHIDKDNTFRLVIGVYRKNTYFECQIDRSFAVKGK